MTASDEIWAGESEMMASFSHSAGGSAFSQNVIHKLCERTMILPPIAASG